jgi:hypothetical protein
LAAECGLPLRPNVITLVPAHLPRWALGGGVVGMRLEPETAGVLLGAIDQLLRQLQWDR